MASRQRKTFGVLSGRNDIPIRSSKNHDPFLDTLRHMVTADPLTFERLTA
jgi:hypothetical protein